MKEILEQILIANINELNNYDMSFVEKYQLTNDVGCCFGLAGREHYRLLVYISKLFDKKILFDVGTNACRSALCLAHNKANTIKTFDVIKLEPKDPDVKNVEFIIGDSTKDPELPACPFVMLDVNHDGIYEQQFYNHLCDTNWKGILLLDDIHLNAEMKQFWKNILQTKYDITHLGHWSGTGIVCFGD